MGSTSLHQWEADPLFSAAEVVQDSADRMESLFRLLLHEQSLVQGHHPDPRLLSSLDYHKRDLATIIETAKWQLEDFERAVNLSASFDKSRSREDVISRHRQFIIAIGEQINHVERREEGPSNGDPVRNSEWVDLDERERDVLASFLAGSASQRPGHHDAEDNSILRRFLDPNSASGLNDGEIVEECNHREVDDVKTNGDMHVEHNLDDRWKNSLRNVGSHHSTRLDLDVNNSRPGISCKQNGNYGVWDLEANEATPKNFFHDKLRGPSSRISFFGFLNNLWTNCGSRVARKYTKMLKDGEEPRTSPTYIDAFTSESRHMEQMLGTGSRSFDRICSKFKARYQRLPCRVRVNRSSMQVIFTTTIALFLLCKWINTLWVF